MDVREQTRGLDASIAELAEQQHGVVARRQLERRGVSRRAIEVRLKKSDEAEKATRTAASLRTWIRSSPVGKRRFIPSVSRSMGIPVVLTARPETLKQSTQRAR